jgi:hypothetical protein
MDFLSHLHVVVKHIVKLTRANNNMQMAQKRREKQTVLIHRTSLKLQHLPLPWKDKLDIEIVSFF